MLHRFSI